MPYTDWNAEFSPWRRGMQTIGNALAQRPMVAAQARDREAVTALRGEQLNTERAQQGEIGERTRKTKAEADRMEFGNAELKQMTEAAARLRLNEKNELVMDPILTAQTFDELGPLAAHFMDLEKFTPESRKREAQGTLFRGVLSQSRDASDLGSGFGNIMKALSAQYEAQANRGAAQSRADTAAQSREKVAGINAKNRLDVATANPRTPAGDLQDRRFVGGLLAQSFKDSTNSVPDVLNQYHALTGRGGPAAPRPGKPLDRVTAEQLLAEAKGDKALARKLAEERGYDF